MAFNTWGSYFYPPPDEGTLRNLFDERNPVVLTMLEYVETALRQRELLSGQVAIPKTYDADHVQAIHRHLFQDVYEWAGEYRSVGMFKPPLDFAQPENIDRYLADASRIVHGVEWASMDRQQFATAAAEVFAHVNQAHPFREGNGRTGKVFMEHVAERSRFTLDFSQVPPDVWNNASAMSRPDIGSYRPVPDSLVPVFERLAVPRAPERTRDAGRVPSPPDKKDPPSLEERIDDKLHELRARRKASYPKPATHAPRTAPRTAPEVRDSAKPHRPRGDRGVGSR